MSYCKISTGAFFCLRPFPPVGYERPLTERMTLHSNSLCKNLARASGGAINMYILCWAQKRKRWRQAINLSRNDLKIVQEAIKLLKLPTDLET